MKPTYEQRLAELGITNRGQLADGFKSFGLEKEEMFLSEDRHLYKPPPLTEDLSYMNPKSTAVMTKAARSVWDKMSEEKKRDRAKLLSKAGQESGKSMRRLYARGYRPRTTSTPPQPTTKDQNT